MNNTETLSALVYRSFTSYSVCAFLTFLLGPNELSIRNATVIHDLLGPSGAPKGPGKNLPYVERHRLTNKACPTIS